MIIYICNLNTEEAEAVEFEAESQHRLYRETLSQNKIEVGCFSCLRIYNSVFFHFLQYFPQADFILIQLKADIQRLYGDMEPNLTVMSLLVHRLKVAQNLKGAEAAVLFTCYWT